MIQNIEQAEQALAPYVAITAETTGKDNTTQRTLELSQVVGSPHERLKVVHVAGTSGKTSTSYFISRLLASAGASVGLTVSPHIYNITERLQINTKPLEDEEFCEYLSEFMPLVERFGQTPSYFELMMVFAMWVFDRKGVDYVVLETGLGGLHDSSNICRRADKLCVITDIGFDHTHVLGDTLPEIAAQKAGIIAPGNHVLMHEQVDDVVDIVRRAAVEMHATLDILPAQNYSNYQQHNVRLAHAAVQYVTKRDGLILSDDVLASLDTSVPGRMQIERRGDTTIILDGAHNQQKTAALIKTLQNEYPDQKFATVVAVKDTKDYAMVVEILSSIASTAVATGFHLSQDAPIQSVDPALIQAKFTSNGIVCTQADSVPQAVNQFVDESVPFVLVTGSLYALSLS